MLSLIARTDLAEVAAFVQKTQAPVLFTLLTDSAFLYEPMVKTVWESLENVEGANNFYSASLQPAATSSSAAPTPQELADRELAAQMQAEDAQEQQHMAAYV